MNKETAQWHELKYIYPDLAPPDERTAEERKRQAEQDVIDLYGPEPQERKEEICRSKD